MNLRPLITLAAAVLLALPLRAQYRDDQFKRDAFSQNYADTLTADSDSSKLFSFKQFFGGLSHKRTASIQNLAIGSSVLVGGFQIYNRQYWKLPVIYGGIGAGIGLGIHFNNKFQSTGETKFQTYSTLAYAGAALSWWGAMMDGVACYKDDGERKPNPSKATMYSLLLPGLGQIYNGEAWKVPLYLGLIAGGVYFWTDNNVQYQRWKWTYDMATSTDPEVEKPPQTAETAKHYRDVYRRYRDYSILATALFYLLQVMDANVFAYMQDFEVSDNLSLRMEPSIQPVQYAAAPAVGMTIGFKF
jgi:hypothetical protein